MPRRTVPVAVALLAITGQAYVWWGHWGDAGAAVWIASGCALGGALLGALVPTGWLRGHVAIAAGLMLSVAGFAASRVVGRWPFAWDALPDRRYAAFIAVACAVSAVGLVRGALWARWAAIAFALGSALGGTLNAINLRATRDESLWLAGVGAVGALTLLSQLTRAGVGDHFARRASQLWSSRDRLILATRLAAIGGFAAAPMLVLYALGQPVAPATVASALVLAPVLGVGGALVLARRTLGIVILAGAGVALIAHTVATIALVTPGGLPIAGYYAAFWLPAAVLGVTAGAVAASRARRGPRGGG